MKYSEMIPFMNKNGILLMQPVIANIVDNQIPFGASITDDEFEEICASVFKKYLETFDEDDFDLYDLADEEIMKRVREK